MVLGNWRAGAALLVVAAGGGLLPRAAAETHNLKSGRQPGSAAKIEVLLEVGGELRLVDEGKVRSLPMSVVGRLAYHEKTLPEAPGPASVARSIRHYDRADAVIKIDNGGLKPELRQSRRLITVEASQTGAILFSPQGLLTREELDLVDVPANSLLVERLLPQRPVAVGERWPHPDQLVAALLGLDAVSQSDLSSQLRGVDAERATVDLAGRVQGAIGGVATQMEVDGRYTFDGAGRQVRRLVLVIQEQRSIGPVGPGMDVTARLQMTITPDPACAALSDEVLAGLPLAPNGDLADLCYESAAGGFRFQHDRRWHIMSDKGDVLALRLVDRGDVIAQCNVAALASMKPGRHSTLAAFQDDIQRSLNKHFGRFVEASQTTSAAGHLVYRVVAAGEVADLAIQWNYYLVADSRGNQVVFAFTVEEDLVDDLATADQEMVATLDFTRPPIDAAAKPAPAPPTETRQ